MCKLAAHVMVNLFIMEHKLSNQATEELIQTINFLLPGGHKFVRSGYLLKKYFVNLFDDRTMLGKYPGSRIPPTMDVCVNAPWSKSSW